MRRSALIFAAYVASITADTDSHRRADGVLFPAFVSACNDYSTQHHPDELGHFQKLDRHDAERLELANKRWREFYEAMK